MALDDPTVGIADDWKASLLDSSQSEMIIQSVGVAREVNTMVQAAKVEFDDHFDTAGKQMAFLTWFESMMRDLLALAESSPEGRRRYNESPEIGGYVVNPEEFARARLKLGELILSQLTERCFDRFTGYEPWSDSIILRSIEQLSLLRNAFAHAHLQPHRPSLFYTPNSQGLTKIRHSLDCWICLGRVGSCGCHPHLNDDPPPLVIRVNDTRFLDAFHDHLKRIDLQCFIPTAYKLGVVYQGLTWESPRGYMVRHVVQNRLGGLDIQSDIVELGR